MAIKPLSDQDQALMGPGPLEQGGSLVGGDISTGIPKVQPFLRGSYRPLSEDDQKLVAAAVSGDPKPAPAGSLTDKIVAFAGRNLPKDQPQLQSEKLAQAYGFVSDTDPDKEALDQELARELNIPVWVLKANDDNRKAAIEILKQGKGAGYDWDALSVRAPKLSAFLQRPENMAVAKDDVTNLAKTEWFFDTLKRGWASGQKQIELANIGSRQIFGNNDAALEARAKQLEAEMSADNGPDGWFPQSFFGAAQLTPQLLEQLRSGSKYAAVGGLTVAGGAAATGVGLPAAAPAGFAAMGAGMYTGAMETAFKLEAGAAYREYIGLTDVNGKPIDRDVAKVAAIMVGAANAGLEAFKLKWLVESIPGADKIVAQISRQSMKEMLRNKTYSDAFVNFAKKWAGVTSKETAAEILQEGITILGLEGSKKVSGQTFAPVPEGAYAGRLVETGVQSFQAFSILALPGPMGGFIHDSARAAKAQTDMQTIHALGDNAAASKTLARMPAAYQAFIKEIKKDGPVDNIYIPASAFVNYFQDNAPKVAQELGIDSQLVEQLQAGGDLAIPLEVYQTKLAGTEHHAQLAPDLKLREGDMTYRESQDFEKRRQQYYQQELAKAKDILAVQSDETRQANQVAEQIKMQLIAEGRKPDVAAADAQVIAARAVVAARQLGITPVEWMKRKGIIIEKADTPRMRIPVTSENFGPVAERTVAAIAAQESGGRNIQNQDSGAMGVFQIMPENWGPWAQEAGLGAGAEMTVENQQKVAAFKIQQYLQQFGSPDLVAAAWYAGPAYAQSLKDGKPLYDPNTRFNEKGELDPNGKYPSVNEYISQVMGRMGQTYGQYAGTQANTADILNLARAQEMEVQGFDPETIRQDTGWFKGMEGKWRFEINDSDAQFTRNISVNDYGDLGNILQHPALFAAYPHLQYIPTRVTINPDADAGGHVQFDPISGEQSLDIRGKDQQHAMRILLHEIQHLIQGEEDFASGGSIAFMADVRKKAQQMQGAAALREFFKGMAPNLTPEQKYQELVRTFTNAGALDMLPDMEAFDLSQNPAVTEDMLQRWDGVYNKMRGKSDYQAYRQLAGEIEARDTMMRMGLSEEGRRVSPPQLNPDAIIHYEGRNFSYDPELRQRMHQVEPAPGPTFFSKLAFELTQLKQDTFAPDQLLGMLKKAGVKDDELKWSGLKEFLTGRKKVSKAEVLKFIAAEGSIRVDVVQKGAGNEGRLAYSQDPEDGIWQVFTTDTEEVIAGFEFEGEAREFVEQENARRGNTKYSRYVVPGGENYREVLLTLPEERVPIDIADADAIQVLDLIKADERANNYRSSHWDEPNVLAHVRLTDRTDAEGKKVLFVEEIQSDWAQEGRKKGFKDSEAAAAQKAEYDRLNKERKALIAKYNEYGNLIAARQHMTQEERETEREISRKMAELGSKKADVPSAPFVTSTDKWVTLALKQVIRMAAEGGYSSIAFATGEQNAGHYDLSKHVSSIHYNKVNVYADGAENTKYYITALGLNRERVIDSEYTAEQLPDVIGKELAEKIVNDPNGRGEMTGLDLKVGGEGMRAFYDKMVPQIAQKFLKQFGVDVGKTAIADTTKAAAELGGANTTSANTAFDITPRLRNVAINEGFPLFQATGGGKRGAITFEPGRVIISLLPRADRSTFIHESGHLFLEDLQDVALSGRAPAAVADLEIAKEWLGVTPEQIDGRGRITFTREQHEKFARGWEAYLMEGSAPSTKLKEVFRQFKRWLTQIYRSIKGLNVEITPEVRGMMDRLIATEDEIAEAENLAGYHELFREEAGKGISLADYNAYLKLRADARATAEEILMAKHMEELTDERKAQLAAERERVMEAAWEEVRQLPVYRALAVLTTPEAQGGMKINAASLVDFYGEGILGKLPKTIYSGKAAMTADDAADVFGYSSGDELIQALAAAPPIEAAVQDRVNSHMADFAAQTGIDLKAEALAAIHNEKRVEVLAMERQILDDLTKGGSDMDARIRTVANKQLQTALSEERQRMLDEHIRYLVKNSALGVERRTMTPDEFGEYHFAAGFSNNHPWYADITALTPHGGLPSGWYDFIEAFKAGEKDLVKMPKAMREVYEMVADQHLRNGVQTLDGFMPENETYLAVANMADDVDRIMKAAPAEYAPAVPVSPESARQMSLDFEKERQMRAMDALSRQRAVQAAAKKQLATKRYVEATQASRYFAAERRAQQLSEMALRAGRYEDAANYKDQQLLNHALAMESLRIKTEVDKTIRYFERFTKKGSKLSIDPDYREQIDDLLERFDFRKVGRKALEKRKSLREWIIEQEANMEVVTIPDRLRDEAFRVHYTDLTVEELRDLEDSVRNIEHLGRLKNKLLTAKNNREYSAAVADVEAAIYANNTVKPQSLDPNEEGLQKWLARARSAHASLSKMEFIVRQLDGHKDLGTAWYYLFRPIIEAEESEIAMRRTAQTELKKLFSAYAAKERASWKTKKFFIKEINLSLNKENILSLALNWGNEGNRLRVRDGFGWTDEQVNAVFDQHMDKRDWDFVQGIWDYINSYYPEINRLTKDVAGIKLPKVDAMPVQTQFGEYAGGYYPIKYDPRKSEAAFSFDEVERQRSFFENQFFRAATKQGHTKARVETVKGRPLRLDMTVLAEHLTNVIHDLSYRRAVRDVDKMIRNKRIQEAIVNTLGREIYRQFNPWLQAIANEYSAPANYLEGLAQKARKGTTIVAMGWRVTTAIAQPLGAFNFMDRVGAVRTISALGGFYAKPWEWREQINFVMDASPFMRTRISNYDRDVRAAVNDLIKENKWDRMKETFFWHIGFMDLSISVPMWIDEYNHVLDQSGDKEKALRSADALIRQTQGSGSVKDLAAIQRGSEIQKLFTMFYTYFSALYNLFASRMQQTNGTASIPRLVAAAAYLWFFPALMGELVTGRGPDDDDDEDEKLKWLLRTVVAYPFQAIPGVRDMVSAMTSGYDYRMSPAADAVESFVKAGWAGAKAFETGEDQDLEKFAWKSGEALTYFTGLPGRQLMTTLHELYDYVVNDADFDIREALLGKKKKH